MIAKSDYVRPGCEWRGRAVEYESQEAMNVVLRSTKETATLALYPTILQMRLDVVAGVERGLTALTPVYYY